VSDFTSGELAVLDSLIAVAQRVGYSSDVSDEEDCDNHVCAEHSHDFMGRWQDTRHDGVVFAYVDHDILPRLQRPLSEVDKPTAAPADRTSRDRYAMPVERLRHGKRMDHRRWCVPRVVVRSQCPPPGAPSVVGAVQEVRPLNMD
jgi:hypothetical protein